MHPTLALIAALAAQADSGAALEIGRTYHLQSRALGETRVIDVSLPAGYGADSSQRYPVVVVLDGEFEHPLAATIARFYAASSQLPPLIVVGVRNVDRARDMTTLPVAGFATPPEVARAGGAERFLAFIGDELIPFIDRSYRTTPMRVLIGHSLGGLMAAYSLGKRPELFTGYILMEPSLWWNRGWERDQAKAMLAQPVARHARVMLVNVESWEMDTTAWGGNKPMVRQLSTSGETHSSMAAAGMLQGLRTMFADFKPTEWRPGTHPIAMLNRYDTLAARVGYAVPIPEDAFATVARMSLDARHFDDAAQVLDRMERTYGPSAESREYRDRLTRERAAPAPAAFIPLEFPTTRPAANDAARFIGRWVTVAQPDTHEVTIRVAGDTIVVHDRIQMRGIDWFQADDPVIQLRADGTLEWGLPFFRGLAALVVLQGKIESDGTMTVTREVRGWVPRGPPGADLNRTERFRRVGP